MFSVTLLPVWLWNVFAVIGLIASAIWAMLIVMGVLFFVSEP